MAGSDSVRIPAERTQRCALAARSLPPYNSATASAALAIQTCLTLHRQRERVTRFQSAGAANAERAIPLGKLGSLSESVFRRMTHAGVFIKASDDRWYLDAAAWDRFQSSQRRRSVMAALVIVAIVGVLLALWMTL